MNSQLDQIRALIEANELSFARDELKKFLAENPENAQGWFLASFAQSTPEMRLASIRRAATLRPDQQEIQKRLVKLESAVEKKKSAIGLPTLAIIGFVLVLGLVLAVVFLNRNTPPVQNELPTLAVLLSITDTPIEQAKATTTSISVLQPQTTSVSLEVTRADSTIEPTIQTTVVSLTAPTPIFTASRSQLNNPPPTPYIGATPFITPTLVSGSSSPISTPTISSQPTLASPTVMPTDIQTLPLKKTVNIAAGEFRVVDATRGAESMIQDLGGTFPPAPAQQSWMLLELLLICKNGPTCAFDPSTLKIVGSSGTLYSYSPQLNLIPVFGTITENNQIWGYLGFTIPTNETSLKLTLSADGQTYVVPLE
jgi:hypothetical protein